MEKLTSSIVGGDSMRMIFDMTYFSPTFKIWMDRIDIKSIASIFKDQNPVDYTSWKVVELRILYLCRIPAFSIKNDQELSNHFNI